ncbi:hypothetical protein HG531_001075 [Fusarium graminearum]|nr:hypothetical protein HG531_001075 [Fusarium graminearum]
MGRMRGNRTVEETDGAADDESKADPVKAAYAVNKRFLLDVDLEQEEEGHQGNAFKGWGILTTPSPSNGLGEHTTQHGANGSSDAKHKSCDTIVFGTIFQGKQVSNKNCDEHHAASTAETLNYSSTDEHTTRICQGANKTSSHEKACGTHHTRLTANDIRDLGPHWRHRCC